MKKVGLALIIILIVSMASLMLFSCSDVTQSITYNNVIESKYGDAFIDLATTDAPDSATEFASEKRITRKILVDGRVKGSHILGLYAPMGEQIEVTIDAAEIANGHSIEFNENCSLGEVPFSLTINSVTTTFSRTLAGAMLELKVADKCANTFEITIKGAVDMPYYRYGIDDDISYDEVGNYAILDCTNVRIYQATEKIEDIQEPKKVMNWWRNAVTFMDEILGLSFWDNDYSPMKIYIRKAMANTDPPEVDVENNCIYLPEIYDMSLVNWDTIYADKGYTGDTSVYNMLKLVAQLKVEKSGVFKDTYLKDYIVDILTQLTYIDMVDAYYANNAYDVETPNPLYVTDAENTGLIIYGGELTNSQKYCALFTNIYYSFSRDVVKDLLIEIRKEKLTDARTIATFADEQEINLTELANKLNISLYGSDIEKMSGYSAYPLIANKLTYGGCINSAQTGYHVRIGEKKIFDFADNCVPYGEYQIDGILGQEGAWVRLDDGKYEYTPSADKLSDTFTIVLKKGDQEVKLIGAITVDIAISEYIRYENVSFKTLDDAKSGYKDILPTKVESRLTASIPLEGEEKADKTFSVAQGAIEVEETGYYTLFLKSSGLCSVSFGVKEYYAEIFNNSLTVPTYTDELSYTAKLEEGFKYIYTIYNLANSGLGYAQLGIKYGNDPIVDIDDTYLVYSKLDRNNIVEYSAPQYYIEAMSMQEAEYNKAETTKIAQFVNIPTYEIGKTSDVIEKDSKVSFVLPLKETDTINYVRMTVADMEGVKVTIYGGVMYKVALGTIELKDGLNTISCEERNADSIKLEFTAPFDYKLHILDLETGECISAMTIIPSSSTDIEYISEWETSRDYIALNGRLAVSNSDNSELSYSFNGNEISIYATVGPAFGAAKIIIDGQDKGLVDLNSTKVECAKLIFNQKLKDGDHTIKISAVDSSPINLDYLAVSSFGETKQKNDFSKLWYVSIIPGILLIVGIVFISLDAREKKKKANIQ